jgi:hypothetical protein
VAAGTCWEAGGTEGAKDGLKDGANGLRVGTEPSANRVDEGVGFTWGGSDSGNDVPNNAVLELVGTDEALGVS